MNGPGRAQRFAGPLALLVLASAGPAGAAEPEGAPEAVPTRRVLVLPVQHYTPTPEGVIRTIEGALVSAVDRRPGLAAMGPAGLTRALQAARLYHDRVKLARDLVRAGVEDYERMRLPDAVSHLEEALKLFRQTAQRWIDGREVAEALLTLALSHLENGRLDKAHLAFKALLAIDPLRELKAGFYSQRAIGAFGVARADLMSAADLALPVARAVALANIAGARFVVSAHVRERARGSAALVTSLVDVARRREIDRESIAADPDRLEDSVDRLVSRLVACIGPEEPAAPAEDPFPQGRWRLGAAFESGLYGARPSREVFVEMGVVVRAARLLSPHLVALGRLGLARSTTLTVSSVSYEDLRTPLDTVRGFVGIGPRMASGSGAVVAQAAVGADVLVPSEVRVTRDAHCKWGPPYACRATRHDPDVLFGPGLAASLSWAVVGPVTLQVEAGTAFYVLAAGANDLNVPVRLSAGLGYRF